MNTLVSRGVRNSEVLLYWFLAKGFGSDKTLIGTFASPRFDAVLSGTFE